MDMWKRIEELAKQAEQSTWLALENDGDRATVVFLGDPYPREVVFIDGKYAAFDETHRARGLRPTVRISINVALVDTGEVKVLERGVLFFKELAAIRGQYPLDRWSFEIVRNGPPGSLKTTYRVERDEPLSATAWRMFATLPRYDLARLAAGSVSTEARAVDQTELDAPTIATRDAQAIIGALRALSRDATARFLERFSVARIRDVARAHSIEAMEFVDGLVREAEVDPYS
jgi:hypothetical protein